MAGERYTDEFGFALGSDGGLDWRAWVLERRFDGGLSETTYACSGDSAYYRPAERAGAVQHVCESAAGIRSDGKVEHQGRRT